MNRPQEACLESVAGAGAHYMVIYDDLHPQIRARLRECSQNWCLACMGRRVERLVGNIHNQDGWNIVIDSFERGDFNVERARIYSQERGPARYGVQGFYRQPAYPTIDVYDPRGSTPRSFTYDIVRGPQARMDGWADILSLDDIRAEFERLTAMNTERPEDV